jgi:hypothetical protein
MKIEENRTKYDDLQLFLTKEIVGYVKVSLDSAGLKEDDLYDLTEAIAFNIAATIDGSAIMTHKGERVIPFLAFASTPDKNNLLAEEGGSWMHEYVSGAVEEAFDVLD